MVVIIKGVRVFLKLAVPVGLLVLLALLLPACGGSSGKLGHVGSVQVRITSSVKTFIPDVSYHFIIKNTGRTAHEFIVAQNHAAPDLEISGFKPNCLASWVVVTISPVSLRGYKLIYPTQRAHLRMSAF